MKTIHYIVVFIIVACGLGVSVLLLPSSAEIALIRFKDKDFESARKSYESRLAAGDLSAAVVMPLSQLYLQYGEVNSAIQVMERYLAGHPADINAKQLLGKYYQFAQRPYEYQLNLETVVNENPTEDGLRELSGIYNFSAQFDKQIVTLEKLITLFPQKHTDFLDLANLQASQGQFTAAVRTLIQFESQHAQHVNPSTVQLLVSLQLDAAMPKAAADRAIRWLKQHPNPQVAARFVALLHFKGHPVEAMAVIEPFIAQAEQTPALLAELVQIEIKTGREDAALARLMKMYEQRRLPTELFEPLIDLLLTRHDVAMAIEVARSTDLSQQPDWLIANLADEALANNRPDFVENVVSQIGTGFFEPYPLVAAEWTFQRGDHSDLSRWLARAEAAELSPADELRLASLYTQSGRSSQAISLLSRLAASGQLPEDGLSDLASQYLEVGRSEEGAQFFDGLRRKRHSPKIDRGWVLLAAAAGREEEVLQWLRPRIGRLSRQALSDLYYTAEERKQRELAVLAAQQLYAGSPDRGSAYRLALAFFNAGRFADAARLTREFMTAGPSADEEALYLEALSKGWRQGEPFGDELRAYWSRQLGTPNLLLARREEIVYNLLDLNDVEAALPAVRWLAAEKRDPWLAAYSDLAVKAGRRDDVRAFLTAQLSLPVTDLRSNEALIHLLIEVGGELPALPFLKQFAEALGNEWAHAYEDALGKTRRDDELLSFRVSRAARSDITTREKGEIATRIFESGHVPQAVAALLPVAAKSAPHSSEVEQLLFFWGLPAPNDALDWLENRARSVSGTELAGWLELLTNAGAFDRVASIASNALQVRDDERIADLYLQALAAQERSSAAVVKAGDRPERTLAAALGREIGKRSQPGALRLRARLALENELPELAAAAFEKLYQSSPNDLETLRWLGALKFANGYDSEAESYLQQYFAANGDDYESRFYLGELLFKEHKREAARAEFARSLELLDPIENRDAMATSIHAQTLDRLGRTAEALAEFEGALQRWNTNRPLRADYVIVLLRTRRYGQAQSALAQAGDENDLRLGMLRGQLLMSQGLWRHARQHYSGLSALDPFNAEIRRTLQDRFFREHSSRIGLEFEGKTVRGAQSQEALRMNGHYLLPNYWSLGVSAVREDTRLGSMQRLLKRGEIYAQYDAADGSHFRATLHSADSLGSSITFARSDGRGSTAFTLEYRKPFLEFSEGLFNGGTRDRFEFRREYRLQPNLIARAAVAKNRYGLRANEDHSNVSSAFAFEAGLTRVFEFGRRSFFLEYVVDAERAATATNQALSLVSRETHAGSLSGAWKLHSGLQFDGFGGFAVDRLGGRGPFYGARLSLELPGGFETQGWLERRLNSVATGQLVNRYALQLLRRF